MTALQCLVLIALGAYLLGSVPFGLLLTRAAGAGDIRQIGSGNIGATNVLRTGRKGIAVATLLLDAFKGFAAVGLARGLCFELQPALTAAAMSVAGFCAVLGHCFPVWLRFKGGKGVATGIGVFWGLAWPVGLACTLIWIVGVKLSRVSSIGALTAFLSAPFLMLLITHAPVDAPLPLAADAIALLVLCRHWGNLSRLVRGKEPRVGEARPQPSDRRKS